MSQNFSQIEIRESISEGELDSASRERLKFFEIAAIKFDMNKDQLYSIFNFIKDKDQLFYINPITFLLTVYYINTLNNYLSNINNTTQNILDISDTLLNDIIQNKAPLIYEIKSNDMEKINMLKYDIIRYKIFYDSL